MRGQRHLGVRSDLLLEKCFSEDARCTGRDMRHLWPGREWDYKKNEEGRAETEMIFGYAVAWEPSMEITLFFFFFCINYNHNALLTVSTFSSLKEELEFRDIRDLI